MQISKHFIYKLNQFLGYPAIIEERDACGVDLLVHLNGLASHFIVKPALAGLKCIKHRGACGADGISGDDSGVTTQMACSLLLKDLNYINKVEPNQKMGLALIFLPEKVIGEKTQIF